MFGGYLRDTRFSVDQINFVHMIVEELTANGTMEPSRLFESPYTDNALTGPGDLFPEVEVGSIVATLKEVTRRAEPLEVA